MGIANWFRRRERERDLAEEIESHLRMAREDRESRGADAEEARFAARREMGNRGQIIDATRRTWGRGWLVEAASDARFGLRAFGKNLGFAAIAMLTLGLGIGATTAMFTLIDRVLIAGAPYPNAGRLIVLHQMMPALGEIALGASGAEFVDYRTRNRSCASMTGYQLGDSDLTGSGEPGRITAVRVTANFFSTLRVRPLLGRAFGAAEDVYGGPRVAVLSFGFWQSHFGGNANALGRTIRLDERTYTVIGVMPRGFEFPNERTSLEEAPSAWIPGQFSPDELHDRASSYDFSVIARLKDGVSVRHAQEDLSRLSAEFQREHPDVYGGNTRPEVRIERLGEAEAARQRPALIILGIAVLLVLLIACANVANLLLARGSVRRREMAVRSALGANGWRLARQLLVESTLLSAGAAALGCALAEAIVLAVSRFSPAQLVELQDLRVNGAVLALAVALSIVTGLLCGVAPAIQVTETGLKEGGRSATGTRGAHRLRRGLVIGEAALAVMLLIGAALLIRSFTKLMQVPPGFEARGVALVRTSFNRQRYGTDAQRRNAERAILERLRALPGVRIASLTTHLPLADDRQIGFRVEGGRLDDYHWADNALVDVDYFRAMRIPLRGGRTFDRRDNPTAPVAAIINETMAKRFWPKGDALGKYVLWGDRRLTIVGIAGDVRVKALDASPGPMIYNSEFQLQSGASGSAVFVLRSDRKAAALASAARRVIWSVDRNLPVFAAADLERVVVRSAGERKFSMLLLSAFATLAMALSAVGLYSVLAQSVAQRRQELGIRLALGADPPRLVGMIVREGVSLALAGIAAGVVGGLALAFLMSRLLFGIGALDGLSFGAAVCLLISAAIVASLAPALKAARVDPLEAMRCE